MTSPLRVIRNDAAVAALTPPDHAYEVRDGRDRLLGMVAGSGRAWTAGRIGPTRSRPFIACVRAGTRADAVDRLVRGRP